MKWFQGIHLCLKKSYSQSGILFNVRFLSLFIMIIEVMRQIFFFIRAENSTQSFAYSVEKNLRWKASLRGILVLVHPYIPGVPSRQEKEF